MQVTDDIKAYAAGFLDGEGYIGVVSSGSRYVLQVNIGQCDERPLRLLCNYFGGSICLIKRNNPRRPIYKWTLPPKLAAEFLKAVRPWLLVKGEQADLALEFQKNVVFKKHGLQRHQIITDQRKIYHRMKELKTEFLLK